MADTWGGSWGTSWGTSWHRSPATPEPEPEPSIVGSSGGGGRARDIAEAINRFGLERRIETDLKDIQAMMRLEDDIIRRLIKGLL